jgi:hypothetical protein
MDGWPVRYVMTIALDLSNSATLNFLDAVHLQHFANSLSTDYALQKNQAENRGLEYLTPMIVKSTACYSHQVLRAVQNGGAHGDISEKWQDGDFSPYCVQLPGEAREGDPIRNMGRSFVGRCCRNLGGRQPHNGSWRGIPPLDPDTAGAGCCCRLGAKAGAVRGDSVRGESHLGRACGFSEVAESQTEPPSGAVLVILFLGMPIPAKDESGGLSPQDAGDS